MNRFSSRHELASGTATRLVRDSAPEELRSAIINFLKQDRKLEPDYIRDLVAGGLQKLTSPRQNWGRQQVWNEVVALIDDAPWYRVYDAAEFIYRELRDHHHGYERGFEAEINRVLIEHSLAWEMREGVFVAIGNDVQQILMDSAIEAVGEVGFQVAHTELQSSQRCLSVRPNADLSGAVSHAMSSLESVMRAVTGDKNAMVGAIVDKHPELFPKPLNEVVPKLWGFASNHARHGSEERDLDIHKARLVVGIAASLVGFLAGNLND